MRRILTALVAAALLACGGKEASSVNVADAAPEASPKYCYQFGGPSDVPPDAADAEINLLPCDVDHCAQARPEITWFCFESPTDGGRD